MAIPERFVLKRPRLLQSAPLAPTRERGRGRGGCLSTESITETQRWLRISEYWREQPACTRPLTPNPSPAWSCEKIRPVRAPGLQQRLQLPTNQWRRRALTPRFQRILKFFTAPVGARGTEAN